VLFSEGYYHVTIVSLTSLLKDEYVILNSILQCHNVPLAVSCDPVVCSVGIGCSKVIINMFLPAVSFFAGS